MKRILAYLKPYTMTIAGILFLKLFAALMDLLIPSILEIIIDQIIPTGSVPRIFLWGGVMIVCSVLAIVTNVSANRRTSIMSGNVTGVIRHDLFEKVSYLAPSQIDDFTASSLISRLTSDTYNINQFISRMLRLGVRSPILLLGGIIITLTLDPVLTLVLLAMLPPIIVITYFVTKKSIPMYTHVQETLDKLVRTVQENITGIRVIKALSKSEYERQRFDGVNTGLSDEEQNVSLVTAVSKPANTLILNIGLTLVVLAGAFRVNSGLTQPGKIIAFLSYFSTILNALLGITRIFTIATKGIASGNRVSEVMDSKELLLPEEKEERGGDDYIVFDHVSFSYNKVENNITDLSFALKKGDTLGIIGSTGSGKSTILNLLMRFYDPDSGAIYIGGKDIRSIPHSKLARLFGVAFQNDFLMADSIRENVDYGRGLTEEQLDKALRCAQAESFVSQVEGGKDYELAVRGNNISGGQKQRLLIARALAAEPDILILDDSSSALDYKTDAQLRKALHTDFADTTSVIVAQRVSSILHSNLILVLDDGHVIGCGTHEELMQKCDSYRQIAETQMGGGAGNA